MQSTSQPLSAPVAAIRPTPVLPASITRRLAVSTTIANFAAVTLSALLIGLLRPDWWPAWIAAASVALVGVAVSTVVLSGAAGRTVDWLVTFVMGASVARLGVSLVGLLVALQLFKTPAEPTAYLICGFYALTLIVESTLLVRATGTAAVAGETHA